MLHYVTSYGIIYIARANAYKERIDIKMTRKEWLETQNKNDEVTFIIAKAVKDENSPMYHYEYRTTPIRAVWDWLNGSNNDKYIVINTDHPPIDITNGWGNWYKRGSLKCAIITTNEDLFKMYSGEQAERMIEYYDRICRSGTSK